MKPVCIAVTLILWAAYALGHDKEPTPRWNHIAIHLIYAACLIGAVKMP